MGEVFETTDVEAVEDFLRGAYGDSMRIGLRGQQFAYRRVTAPLCPQVQFQHSRVTMSLEFTSPPIGVLSIGHLRGGRMAYCSDGSDRPLLPGDVYLAVQPGHPWTAAVHDVDVEGASIDLALLSQVADTEPGRARQPVRLTGYGPVSPQAAQRWKDTYAYIRDTVLASPDAAGQPLLAASAARLLAAAVLAVFPNNALAEPTIGDRHDGHPGTLRRAVAFIEENAHTGITPADIAAACSVSIRAIQLAFRRHLDTTPTAYLRRVRLDQAHRELLAADPADKTVTAVAYRWGFPSASRFTARYRAAYGVLPSETLRRG